MIKSRVAVASLLAASALTFAAPAQAQRVDHIVSFGDSYADTGNAVAMILANPGVPLATKQQVAQLYGSGRFSGGTNYIDTLSQLLGVDVENYAVGGALTGTGNVNTGLPGFTHETQIFLSGTVPPGTPFPDGDGAFEPGDLLAVSVGGNDARAYEIGGGPLLGAPAAATAAAATASANLDLLVGAGAETISFLAGNTAILPEVAARPNPAAAAEIRNAFSTTFNTAIQSTLAGYAADGVMVHYLDLTLVGQQIMADPAKFGLIGVACPNPAVNPVCVTDPGAGYLFYVDGLHLTSAGFAIVGKYIAAQLQAPLTLQAPSDLGLDVARQFGRTLSSRMDLGAPRDGDMPEGLKFFIVGDAFSRKLNSGPINDAYRASGVGATIGAEYGFGSGIAGLALNYTRPKANFTSDASDVEGRSIQIGGYAAFGIAGGFIQAYAGYGWDKHEIERAGVVDPMEADPKGSHFTAGVKGGYLMPVGEFRIGPVIALDYAKAKVDGYTEEGDPALTLDVSSLSYRSLRGSIGLEARGDFAAGGTQLRPFIAATLEKDFTGDERTVRFAQTASPTIVNSFDFEDGSTKAYGRAGLGFSARILDTVTIDAGGSTTIGKKQGNETSGQLGVRFSL